MSEKLVLRGLLPSDDACGREKNTEAQRARRRGATSASVTSVPLCFKSLDKNMVLLKPLKAFVWKQSKSKQLCLIGDASG